MRIGFSLNKSDGGPSGFLKKLKASIQSQNLARTTLCFNPLTSFNLFANKAYNFWGKPYIFRVDGITFDSTLSETEFWNRNKDNFKGIQNAKGIIYQTHFSKKMVNCILNLDPQPYEIIINGTDLTRFRKDGPDMRSELNIPPDALVFVTSAKWRTHKRLNDIIEVYKRFREGNNHETYLIVIGNTPRIDNSDNIIYLDQLPNTDLPKYLRTGNCYLFLSWLDTCPNSVIEALACGVPVICSNQGGTREIVELTNGGIIAEADKAFDYKCTDLYNPPSVDYGIVVAAINQLFENYDYYINRINTEPIDINNVAVKYHDFIKSLN